MSAWKNANTEVNLMHENFRQFCNSGATLFQEKTDRAVILATLNILKAHFHIVSRDEICFARNKKALSK